MAKLCKAKLDALAWDYLDEGSEDEASLRDNRRGFDDLIIRPQFLLHDVSKIDISTTLFGKRLEHPIFFCPTGGKNCVFPNGEADTALAARRLEDDDDHGWRDQQHSRIRQRSQGMVAVHDRGRVPHEATDGEFQRTKLKDQGCTGISVTVDIYHVSHRERSVRNRLVRHGAMRTASRGTPRERSFTSPTISSGLRATTRLLDGLPTPTWDTLQRLRETTDLPVIVKGVMTSEDTSRAVKYGMSGVVVSNHGARQLDQVGGTIEALPECVEAAEARFPYCSTAASGAALTSSKRWHSARPRLASADRIYGVWARLVNAASNA